jgi:hypothetical protein
MPKLVGKTFSNQILGMRVYMKLAMGSVRVLNLVSNIKKGTQTEGVREQGTEEYISSDGRLEKIA